ncbi:carbohydrate porin [Chelatococcus reniformis]|uniref:Porin B n=1 Tax=Chelatococcus reniformis TaxID=1494448 RepID=A0A916TXF5_9HYPH|nr:carbohydrate porin [Chelatococcus reniformis]GGC49581.1 porin B [Chelatococcus reniformis]
MLRLILAIAAASAAALASASAHAESPTQLLGDWGGLRSAWAQRGVEFQIGYTEEGAGNVSGGDHRYVRGAGQLALGTTLDFGRLFGIAGGTLQVTLTNRNGRNLASDAGLDTLQLVQEVYGRGNIWRLTQMWYEQQLLGGAVSWKLGRMTIGEDFAAFSCDFQNLTFCGATPGNLVGNYWYNWPVSQWGTRLRVGSAEAYVQVGAYQVDPKNIAEDHGFFLGGSGTTGALMPAEIVWQPTFNGLAGSYSATVWYDSSHADDVYYNRVGLPLALAGGPPLLRQGRYGISFHVLQQVLRTSADDPKRGLSAFVNFTQTDRRTSQIDNQVAFGLIYTGVFDSRPRDVIAVALGRTQVNSRYAQTEAFTNLRQPGSVQVQRAEYVLEAYYNVEVTGGLELRPNVQLIRYPGGVTSAKDAVVLGIKAVVNL